MEGPSWATVQNWRTGWVRRHMRERTSWMSGAALVQRWFKASPDAQAGTAPSVRLAKAGVAATGETPIFAAGTAEPHSCIEILDELNNLLAIATTDAEGRWCAAFPERAAGFHVFGVVRRHEPAASSAARS